MPVSAPTNTIASSPHAAAGNAPARTAVSTTPLFHITNIVGTPSIPEVLRVESGCGARQHLE